jgi:guanylate kinase
MAARRPGKVIVVAAPSGAGKTSILRRFLASHPNYVFSISATTRKRRPSEKDGVDYFFISKEDFERRLSVNAFLEWEKVYDYYYGTLKEFVEKTIASGKHILIEVDVKGAMSIKRLFPKATLVFIEPPSYEILAARLTNRKTESKEDLEKRLLRAKMELEQKHLFDVSIVNQNLDTAIQELTIYIEKRI